MRPMSEIMMVSVYPFLREVAGDGLVFRVRGTCMGGHIPDNSRITIHRTYLPLPGDVVVIRSTGGVMVHRVIGLYYRRGIGKVLTRADNAHRPDAGVPLPCVLGKVTAVNGRKMTVSLKLRFVSAARFIGFVPGRIFH